MRKSIEIRLRINVFFLHETRFFLFSQSASYFSPSVAFPLTATRTV